MRTLLISHTIPKAHWPYLAGVTPPGLSLRIMGRESCYHSSLKWRFRKAQGTIHHTLSIMDTMNSIAASGSLWIGMGYPSDAAFKECMRHEDSVSSLYLDPFRRIFCDRRAMLSHSAQTLGMYGAGLGI